MVYMPIKKITERKTICIMSGNLRIARSWVDVHSIASIWSWAPLSWLVEDIEATSFSPRESHTPTQVSAPREKLQRLKLLALAWMVYIYNGSFINLYICAMENVLHQSLWAIYFIASVVQLNWFYTNAWITCLIGVPFYRITSSHLRATQGRRP